MNEPDNLTKIDRRFLVQIKEIVDFERSWRERRTSKELSATSHQINLLTMKALVLKDEQFATDAKGKPVGVLLQRPTSGCEKPKKISRTFASMKRLAPKLPPI